MNDDCAMMTRPLLQFYCFTVQVEAICLAQHHSQQAQVPQLAGQDERDPELSFLGKVRLQN